MMYTSNIPKTADYCPETAASFRQRAMTWLANWRQQRKTRQAVETLLAQDDRMLADIGITRADVTEALANGSRIDPTKFLTTRRQERRERHHTG